MDQAVNSSIFLQNLLHALGYSFTLACVPTMSDENTQNQPMDDNQMPLGQGGNQPEFSLMNLDPQVQAGILEQINLTVRAQIAAQFAAGRTPPAAAAGAATPAMPASVPEAAPLRTPTFNWNNETYNTEQQSTVSRSYLSRVHLPEKGDIVVNPSTKCKEKSFVDSIVRHGLHGNGDKPYIGKIPDSCNELQRDTVTNRQGETCSPTVPPPSMYTNHRVLKNIIDNSPSQKQTDKIRENTHSVALNNPGKRARIESPEQIRQSGMTTAQAGSNPTLPARKKRRLFDPNQKDEHTNLKQGKINRYFSKIEKQIPDTQDRINVENLLALDTAPSSTETTDGEGEINQGAHTNGAPHSRETVPDLLEREPILFSDFHKKQNIWALNTGAISNSSRLTELIFELRKHDEDVLSRSIARVKSQMSNSNFKKRDTKKKKPHSLDVDINIDNSLPPQDETLQMPARTKTTWNQARAAAVEAAKSTNRATFYRQAPNQNLFEYWCFGLERTPGYLMKLEEFRSELHQMRLRHAREQMQLAAQHLERETQHNLDSDTGDIIDPVSNIARTTTRSEENKGFRGRGRGGRGASRSWRSNRGKKPYGRSNQPQNK